jgi:BlaI family penicillinase repressor
MSDTLPDLGDLEREVMHIVWARGPIAAQTVREELERPLRESTVRTVLRRLEEKGFVIHAIEGRTFLYRAAEARGHFAARAVKRVVDWFCEGSVDEMLVGMVDAKMLNSEQLQKLSERIAKSTEGSKK